MRTTAVIIALLIASAVMAAVAFGNNPSCPVSPRPQVKMYEDHSGSITFKGWTCVIPAFDSPEDEVRCYH